MRPRFTFTIIFALMATMIWSAAPAWADTIDQSFTSPSSSSAAFYPTFQLGQSFTAGITGRLTGVNLNLSVLSNGPGTIDVDIRTVDGSGAPTSTILGTTTLSFANGSSTVPLSQFIGFPSTIDIVAGQQYAIVITPQTIYNGLWYGYHVDSYTGGKQWASNSGSSWYHYDDPYDNPPRSWDLNFQTYVANTPEPGTMLLLGSGLVGVWLRRRRQA